MKLQLILSKILSFLGETSTGVGDELLKLPEGYKESYYYKVIQPVVDIIDQLLLPIIIVLGALGGIYGIILAVQYAQAENTDKRSEVKKRIIHGVIGIVVMLIILILMKLLASNAEDIAVWIYSSI